jgi:hypothetical protein
MLVKVVVIATGAILTAACVDRREGGGDTTRSARLDTARTATASTSSTDDCVRGEPEPVLRSAASRPAPRFERTGKLEAKEEAQLDDTTSLAIMHGGCAHYVESYTFTIRGVARDTTDSDYWLGRAAAFLRALDVGERRPSQIDDMIKALETAAAKDERYAYGEPIAVPEFTTITCTVRTTAPDTVVVDVTYDVAL